MYELINPVDSLIAKAEQFVLENDRYFFEGFFIELEKFCMENDAVIGGENGIAMLLEKAKSKDTYLGYDIYINDTFNKARELADRFMGVKSPFISKETIAVETNIKHKLITIWIHARRLIRLHNLGTYKGVDLFKLIDPIKKEALLTEGRIYCMSPEIQLMGIYRKLYNPYPAEGDFLSYDQLLSLEKGLFGIIEKSIAKRTKKVVAGARQGKDNIVGLRERLLRALATDVNLGDAIVIGDYGVYLTDSSLSSWRSNHLQIITSIEPGEISQYLSKLVEELGIGGEITQVEYDLKLPGDPQLLKHSFYYQEEGRRINILDIFNSITYELVPYKLVDYSGFGPIKIAGLFALMKFRLIDLYVLQLIINIGGSSSKDVYFRKIEEVISQIIALRKSACELLAKKPFEVFQLDNYLGVYVSENVARKKIIGKPTYGITKYFPILKKEMESAKGGYDDSEVGFLMRD